jgi:hypothetical protein
MFINPSGFTHRRSPTTSGVERSPAGSSLARRSPLKDNTKKKTIKKVINLFIYILLSLISLSNIYLKHKELFKGNDLLAGH